MEEDKSVKEKSFLGKVKDIAEDKEHQIESVSYTHLTLPTILRV